MRIHINSGRHAFTNPEERIHELERDLDSPEVVFLEESRGDRTRKDILKAIVAAPLVTIPMIILTEVVWRLLRWFFRGDDEVVDYLITEYDCDIIPVDEDKFELINKDIRLWTASNWLMILLPPIPPLAAINFRSNQLIFILPILAVFYGTAAASLFLAYGAAVNSDRNTQMADIVEDCADEYSEGCLLVGGDHHEPIAKILTSIENIQITNPTEPSRSVIELVKAMHWGRIL